MRAIELHGLFERDEGLRRHPSRERINEPVEGFGPVAGVSAGDKQLRDVPSAEARRGALHDP